MVFVAARKKHTSEFFFRVGKSSQLNNFWANNFLRQDCFLRSKNYIPQPVQKKRKYAKPCIFDKGAGIPTPGWNIIGVLRHLAVRASCGTSAVVLRIVDGKNNS
jgi:hypothetical protein